MSRTEISTLGEFGLIRRLAQNLHLQQPDTVQGIGDDAAVIDAGDHYRLLSTELLIEGVHFDLSYVPLRHLGYKAVAVAVADIAAMNGSPKQLTVGLGLSSRFSVEAVDELYWGIKAACEAYRVDLVGGDTTASRSGLVLSVTVTGAVPKDRITYRHTAQANDLLCITGDLGAAYLGLQLLEREKQVFLQDPQMQPQLEDKDYLVQRQLKPEARTDIVYELHEAGVVPTAMIDVSDGLASELFHVCKGAGLGARIMEENLPIDDQTFLAASEMNLSPLTAALNGGQDYELLFSIRQSDYERVKKLSDISVIGFLTAEPAISLINKAGVSFPIQAQGWQ